MFFTQVDSFVRVKLFKAYCCSLYGCKLWLLTNGAIEKYCTSWRKALRRLMNLPYNCHSFLLPLLSDTLPFFEEICKRSARFILSCLLSSTSLVRDIVRYGVMYARFSSTIGANALFCCDHFGWLSDDFVSGRIMLANSFFKQYCCGLHTQSEEDPAMSVLELLYLREGYLVFDFDGAPFLTRHEINDLISVTVSC